jgi:signal transduction histidine kinase/ActR/RegA family two-component response regulator
MDALVGRLNFPRTAGAILVIFCLVAAALLTAGRRDYPNLHTILDTAMFLLSGVLALLFWDVGARLGQRLSQWLAISFAVTLALEFVHAIVTVEWSGVLAPITQAASTLRPSTWPPAAYVLPIGVIGAVGLARRPRASTAGFAAGLLIFGAALLVIYYWVPGYSLPAALGITRPTLIVIPALWAIAGWLCWRSRVEDRMLPTLALMGSVLFVAHVAMLYSRAPHDTPAMIAHLGKVGAYLLVLLTLMRLASTDMVERIRAEGQLADLNAALEGRVLERTAELAATNDSLATEVGVRAEAERRARAQLERLDLLQQITRAIGERQDLQSIFQVVVGNVEDHLDIDFACMCLREPGADWLNIMSVGTRSEPLATRLALTERERIAIDDNGLSRCIRGQMVYEPDIAQSSMRFPRRLADGGLRAVVMAPLLVESQVFGVLVAARRKPDSISSGECEFLRQLSEHVALAAHQAQLHGALQQAYDDLRQTQQAIMQQERLRVLGQMASGIAHDINNAISPVALYTESLLEKEPNLSARARSYLEIIQRAIDDVAQTVARMKEFYRQRETQLTLAPVDLNQLEQQVVELTRVRWSDMPQRGGTVIRMVTEPAPELPLIMGIESELREALINLVFNAVDAMPDGGMLTIRTRSESGRTDAGQTSGAARVVIEVVDTGVGMDEPTRQRCLEPFFTTKGERGTGLGLAMVYGVVQRHSADLDIESAPGQGTIMRLSFDASPTAEATLTAPAVPGIPMPRQRILVIDDDPLVLRSLGGILEDEGHAVATANGGEAGIDAVRAAQQRGEPFAVVITDLGMPHLDGRRVAVAVKELRSSTFVILLTGWGQRLAADGEVPVGVDIVLGKPPKLRDLRDALARCCVQRP